MHKDPSENVFNGISARLPIVILLHGEAVSVVRWMHVVFNTDVLSTHIVHRGG